MGAFSCLGRCGTNPDVRAAHGSCQMVKGFDPWDYHSSPHASPLVPRLPIALSNTQIMTVVFRTDAEITGRLVPHPLRVVSDLCVVNIYWMHDAQWFGEYGESAVQIPVELPDGSPAVYSPFLVLGSDAAVAAGREAYGQAKKLGTVELCSYGDLLVGRVERNSIEIINATMGWKQHKAQESVLRDLVPGADTNVNLRVLADGANGYRRELLSRKFSDVVTHESWVGPATMKFRPNAQVPVYVVPIGEIVLGLHRRMDLTLQPAELLASFND